LCCVNLSFHIEQRVCINEGYKRKNTIMKERTRKELHVRVDPEVYAKLRQITFYQRQSVNEVVNRLLVEYLEEKALEEPDFVSPPVL
jgi:predicted HicB family RNase H-like nuclease